MNSNPMPNYFYTDADGNKRGPYNEQHIQELVTRGLIGVNTPLETDTGHTGVAGQIPGLNFNNAAPHPFSSTSQAIWHMQDRTPSRSQANESMEKPWLFDFAFQDIRLPKNARRVCTFIYTCCVITLVINGLIGFFMLNPMYSPETMATAVMFLVFYLFSSFIFLVLVRVACEFLIVLLDWLAENKKASRLYIKNNQGEQEK